MHALRWKLPFGILVTMSTAADGDLRDESSRKTWCTRQGIPIPFVPQHVHGSCVIPLDHEHMPAQNTAEADAAVTSRDDQALGVFGADCPGLVVATPTCLGVAHCGWRGTAAGIVRNTLAALQQIESAPLDTWTALIGPGIHQQDFEVDAPVLQARYWPTHCLLPGRPGRAWLDLPAAIASDCSNAGVVQIARSAIATSRDSRMHSHRRDGNGFPQLLVAWRGPCAG